MPRLLIAARGATAIRVARSARIAGWEPVGVFTSEDRDARWLGFLDDARPVSNYAHVEELMAATLDLGATALHPGTGFGAENSALPRACEQEGVTWIGPSAEAIEQVANKQALNALADKLSIPTPASIAPIATLEELENALTELRQAVPSKAAGSASIAEHSHFSLSAAVPDAPTSGMAAQAAQRASAPLASPAPPPQAILKAIHGGGGRGILRLPLSTKAHEERARAWAGVESLGPFVLQEDISHARHIEIQCALDATGQVLLAGSRECTIQRRAQKIVEEAPAPALPDGLLPRLEEYSQRLLRAVGYTGLGTCEFLLRPDGRAILLEVNARLQVEHAVSELVTGVDLVALQLLLSAGARLAELFPELSPRPDDALSLSTRGHAVEARLYAEDPDTLLPSIHPLRRLDIPLSLPTERAAVASAAHLAHTQTSSGTWLRSSSESKASPLPDDERRLRPSPRSSGALISQQLPWLRLPAGERPRLRVERSTFLGDTVSTRYNEPLALLAAWAPKRDAALDTLAEALESTDVTGPATLQPILSEILARPELRNIEQLPTTQRPWTRWVEEELRSASTAAPAASTASSIPSLVPRHEAILLRAPLSGLLVAPPQAGEAEAGALLGVIEAMKMRVPLTAPTAGRIHPAEGLQAGQIVEAGRVLATLLPTENPAHSPSSAPSATPTRPARHRRPARELVAELADPGSLLNLTDEDAVLTTRARLDGREVVIWAQDPTRLGGTIGLAGSRRVAALIDEAASTGLPIISLLDGGGARIQEGANALAGVGLILAAQQRAHGHCLQMGVVLGPAAGGAAYSPALSDLLLMVDGAGHMFLTGPAVLEGATGERVTTEQLGGARLHSERAGTAHLTVPDEAAAWRAVRDLLAFAPLSTPSGPAALLRPGGAGRQQVPGDLLAARAVPHKPGEAYDVRELLRCLIDRSELRELRPAWASNVVTALAHIEGLPVGIIASQPLVMAGAIDPLASQKIAEHVDLCARLGLPLLTVLDTPGFLPGSHSEASGSIRLGARVVTAYASYGEGHLPAATLVTRQAYGGAFVALGSAALMGPHVRTAAWPQARIGVMDATSAVDITGRKALAHAGDITSREALRGELLAAQREAESAHRAQRAGWVERIIDPVQTRSWIARALSDSVVPVSSASLPDAERGSAPADRLQSRMQPATLRLTALGGVRHPGDGWVNCRCGRRHWGLHGAAGLLVWRWAEGGSHLASSTDAPEVEPAAVASKLATEQAGAEIGLGEGRGGSSIEILMQLRAAWTHQGDTWGLPGGAMAAGESPAEAALRECEEETGLAARELVLGRAHVQDHGDWSYSTFVAEGPNGAAGRGWDQLISVDAESQELRWVRLTANDSTEKGGRWLKPEGYTLLPAFDGVWDELMELLPQPGSPEVPSPRPL